MPYDVVEVVSDIPEEGCYYTSPFDSSITIKRGELPDCRWVLRIDGEFVTRDQYRHDLFEKYNIRVIN